MGVRIVPNPKPEKNVRIATENAAIDKTKISILSLHLSYTMFYINFLKNHFHYIIIHNITSSDVELFFFDNGKTLFQVKIFGFIESVDG